MASATAPASAPNGNFLLNDISFAIDFAPNGTLVKLNDTMTRKRYADTLETIAQYGADVFYKGAMANATIQALKASSGIMTLEDMANYTILSRKPSQITYRDFTITSGSAPSSGEVALAIMKTIEGYKDIGHPDTLNISTHRVDEAMRYVRDL
jgi:gamma-glutamyltranspeptidase/glutathione hydrolase